MDDTIIIHAQNISGALPDKVGDIAIMPEEVHQALLRVARAAKLFMEIGFDVIEHSNEDGGKALASLDEALEEVADLL